MVSTDKLKCLQINRDFDAKELRGIKEKMLRNQETQLFSLSETHY